MRFGGGIRADSLSGTNPTRLDETVGPFYHRCPAAILDLLTEPLNQAAADWRAQCRAFHAKRAKVTGLKPGMRIKLGHPLRFSDGAELDTFEVVRGKSSRSLVFRHGAKLYAPSIRALSDVGVTIITTEPGATVA